MMKKYESPVVEITELSNSDVITASYGDTPWINVEFEW